MPFTDYELVMKEIEEVARQNNEKKQWVPLYWLPDRSADSRADPAPPGCEVHQQLLNLNGDRNGETLNNPVISNCKQSSPEPQGSNGGGGLLSASPKLKRLVTESSKNEGNAPPTAVRKFIVRASPLASKKKDSKDCFRSKQELCAPEASDLADSDDEDKTA